MPKRIKQAKPKAKGKARKRETTPDPSQWAHRIMEQSTAEPERAGDFRAQLSTYMAALGKKGGEVGGKRRMQTMTQAERSAVALKAARARWGKAKRAKVG